MPPSDDPRDDIEREPPGWAMLPVAVLGVVLLIAAVVWLALRLER